MIADGDGGIEKAGARRGADLVAVAEDDVVVDAEVVGACVPLQLHSVGHNGCREIGGRGGWLFVRLNGHRHWLRCGTPIPGPVLCVDDVLVIADGDGGIEKAGARRGADLVAVAEDDVVVDAEVVGACVPLQLHFLEPRDCREVGRGGGRLLIELDRHSRAPSARRQRCDLHRPAVEGLPNPERRVLERGGCGAGVEQQRLRRGARRSGAD